MFVKSLTTDTFVSWQFGASNEGNLLGTIRSLDEVGVVPLNCTVNANVGVWWCDVC